MGTGIRICMPHTQLRDVCVEEYHGVCVCVCHGMHTEHARQVRRKYCEEPAGRVCVHVYVSIHTLTFLRIWVHSHTVTYTHETCMQAWAQVSPDQEFSSV